MNPAFGSILLSATLLAGTSTLPAADAIKPGPQPKAVPFEEIHRLIRQHLAETSDEDFNEAAVKGLIDQLSPHVTLGRPPTPPANTNAPVTKSGRFRNDFGYLQINSVTDTLAAGIRAAVDKLLEDRPLKGLVLDLRFSGGTNYAAAARVAGMFGEANTNLLKLGAQELPSTREAEPILIPVMALTNGETSGASEALAAALRQLKAGLLIGSPTAGEATLFEEFPLSNGQILRVATQPVRLADGSAIPRTGIAPDIQVVASLDEDRRFMVDPYWEAVPTINPRTAAARRRVTEADLVRQRREGIPLQEIVTNKLDAGTSGAATVKDPVLARALDMLKALSVVQAWKQEN